jgi:hypothetical protein
MNMSETATTNIFERASRLKLRFDTPKGLITAEDLWDLPLTSGTNKANLDDVARGLHRELKDANTQSFVLKPAKADDDLQTAFDVVKHVIDVRLAENEEARVKTENREKKQRILELISRKQDEALGAKSVEELQEMVTAL